MALIKGICALISVLSAVSCWVLLVVAVFLPSLFCARLSVIALILWVVTTYIVEPKKRGRKEVR